MPRGNPSPKIAITVPPQLHDMAAAAAASSGDSLSAWIAEAIRRRLQIENGLAAMLEWELENGPLTNEELARAREAVRGEIERHAHPTKKAKRTA